MEENVSQTKIIVTETEAIVVRAALDVQAKLLDSLGSTEKLKKCASEFRTP